MKRWHEVANAIEGARFTVAAGCRCADCGAVVERARDLMTAWLAGAGAEEDRERRSILDIYATTPEMP